MRRVGTGFVRSLLLPAILLALCAVSAAEPPGPRPESAADAACHASARAAMQRRTRVAAYYEWKLALVDGNVWEWRTGQAPRPVLRAAVQVAVSGSSGYAIDARRRLLGWSAGSGSSAVLLDDAVWMAAGDSGLFAIRCDGSLWQRGALVARWERVADSAVHGWIGDGADYYVDPAGGLHVRGKAHRGQYGDGRLTESAAWTRVATDAVAVVAHTGHALYLRRDGTVLGTGGNRFGPLGTHGYGDKADVWGQIFTAADHVATGSRHSLAIRGDGSLWIWGAAEGLQPRQVLSGVVAASGGREDSVALTGDGAVWNWGLGQAPVRLTLAP